MCEAGKSALGSSCGPPGLPRTAEAPGVAVETVAVTTGVQHAVKTKLRAEAKSTEVDADAAIRLGKSPGTLFSSAMSFAS